MLKATAEGELSSTFYTNGDPLCKGCICPIEAIKKMENKLSSFQKRLNELNAKFASNSCANQTVEVMARENGGMQSAVNMLLSKKLGNLRQE